VQGVHVNTVPECRDLPADDVVRLLEEIGFPRQERLVTHPDDHRLECLIDPWQVRGMDQRVASTDVNLVREGHRDGHRRERLLQIAFVAHDRPHPAPDTGGEDHDFVPLAEHTGRDGSAEPAEIEVRTIDVLDGEAKVDQVAVRRDVHVLEVVEERLASIPRHVPAGIDDVVPLQRRHRYEPQIRNLQPGRERRVLPDNRVEDLLGITDEIHLVDGHDDVADSQQRHDEAVPFRLTHDAVACIDQDDGQVAVRCARCHVPRVLFVAWTVGDDELAP
jgi:hypothetical protein